MSPNLLLIAVLIGSFSKAGLAEDITIRLINAKNGRPLQGQLIVLALGDAKLASTPRLRTTTSADGTAVVHLPAAIPDQLSIDVGNGKLHGCGSPFFLTREVMERGVVADNKCETEGTLKGKFNVKPGVAIVFARFLHWWERMQW